MSRFEELINEHCPCGVDFIPLKNVSTMKRGASVTQKTVTPGEIPVISGGQKPAYYCNKSNRTGEVITVAGSGAYAGYVQYWNEPIFVCDAFSVQGKDGVLTKYLFYVLQNMQEKIYKTHKEGGVPHVHISSIENFQIPVPPLPVQEEIVRILDTFSELEAELAQELARRKLQYTFYRDQLLNFESKPKTQWIALENCCKILDNKRKPISKSERENGDYPYYGANGIQDYVSSYIFDGDFVLVGEDGSVITKDGHPIVNWASGKIWVNNHAHVIEAVDGVLLRYLFHYLQTVNVKSLIHGNIPKLTGKDFREIKIPVPALDIQKRLVNVLDNFDAICSDLSIGLPAEISARQKQYEYYRDFLFEYAANGLNRTEQNRTEQNRTEQKLIAYVFGTMKCA